VDFGVVNGWSIRGEMRGKRGREAVTFVVARVGQGLNFIFREAE
jgi:hypothetical protein